MGRPPLNVPVKQQGISENEEQLAAKIAELEEENKQLASENYLASLTDEKVFRLELLRAITRIAKSMEELKSTVIDLATPRSE